MLNIDNDKQQFSKELLSELVVDNEFSKLDSDLKHKIVDVVSAQYTNENKSKYGKISELLGSESGNISLYISGIICITIVLIGLIYILLPQEYKKDSNLEFWNLIIPMLTTTLGYIFGKSVK